MVDTYVSLLLCNLAEKIIGIFSKFHSNISIILRLFDKKFKWNPVFGTIFFIDIHAPRWCNLYNLGWPLYHEKKKEKRKTFQGLDRSWIEKKEEDEREFRSLVVIRINELINALFDLYLIWALRIVECLRIVIFARMRL